MIYTWGHTFVTQMGKMKISSESIQTSSEVFWNRFRIVGSESVFRIGYGIGSGIGYEIGSKIGIDSEIRIGFETEWVSASS